MISELKHRISQAGFDACSISKIQRAPKADYYLEWIRQGMHGSMAWLERTPDRRVNPSLVLDDARSAIFVGLNYYQPYPQRRARIATYALGLDYHDLIIEKLKPVSTWLEQKGGTQKIYVDTGPILEKNQAQNAGLGWQGKSTMLIHPQLGTWLFIGTILTTLDLDPTPAMQDHCGTCTRCITACPTQAITAPYQLDARRCISYLTIEHKGSIPVEFRKMIGDRLYGCDDCLTACPWNRWAKTSSEIHFTPLPLPDLREMLAWNETPFCHTFRGSPIARIKLPRWQRNICIVLGNIGTSDDIPTLESFALHTEPWLAEHAHWAIQEITKKSSSPTEKISP